MGIGKTTLIKALSLHLGVQDLVQSPTFSIVNQYIMKNGNYIYHFDFYRVENIDEVYNIGVYAYLDSSKFCFLVKVRKNPQKTILQNLKFAFLLNM